MYPRFWILLYLVSPAWQVVAAEQACDTICDTTSPNPAQPTIDISALMEARTLKMILQKKYLQSKTTYTRSITGYANFPNQTITMACQGQNIKRLYLCLSHILFWISILDSTSAVGSTPTAGRPSGCRGGPSTPSPARRRRGEYSGSSQTTESVKLLSW